MSSTAHSIATQLATISASADRLARARAHAQRLDVHAADLRAKLDAAAGDATAGPLRGEAVEVDRQRRQAATVLAEVEAEHARHEADLAAMLGVDGQARAALRERQVERDAAKAAADGTAIVLSRTKAHAEAVDARLTAARADEARHDAEAADRLHAALRDGIEAPVAEPFTRTSAGLDDDARAARAAEARAASDHRTKVAALTEAERRVRGAADVVLLAEADSMAREIAALDARADLLRDRLKVYTARTRGDYVEPAAPAVDATRHAWSPPAPAALFASRPAVSSSPAIAAALVDRTFVVERPRDTSGEAEAWDGFAAALIADPEAAAEFATVPAGPVTPPVVRIGPDRIPASWESRPAPAAAA